MTRIAALTVVNVRLPRRRVHKWTGLSGDIGTFVLVRMEGENGLVGWGEAPVIKDWGGDYGRYFGEAPSTARLVIEQFLAPAVTGIDVLQIGALHVAMNAAIKGYPYAKAAIDMAAHDLAGRTLGIPVHTLLGGRVRDRIAITHSIGLMEIEEGVEESRQVAREGGRTIKIKIGVEPERDVEIVHRIREAVGPDVALCVDANCGYATVGLAVQTIRRMEPCRLLYVEQPCEGLDKIAAVGRAIDAPVMADESAWTPRDAFEIGRAGGIDIVSIYTTKPGGLHRARQVAIVAEAAGLICNVNGSVETGIGNLANLHLAAACPAITLSCVLPVSRPAEHYRGEITGAYYTDDLIGSPFEWSNGHVVVPTNPGLGISVDEAKVSQFTVE